MAMLLLDGDMFGLADGRTPSDTSSGCPRAPRVGGGGGVGKASQPSGSRAFFNSTDIQKGEGFTSTWRFIMLSQNGNFFVQERIEN